MRVDHLFYQLNSDQVLDSVERALNRKELGRRATGSLLALNSLENRVYQIEFEDRVRFVAKFYRPGRWSKKQVLEEHQFLNRLVEAEIPAIAPIALDQTADGIFFAVFPSVGGRLLDELSDTHLRVLGRHLGRIHRIGSTITRSSRKRIDCDQFARVPLRNLKSQKVFETPSLEAHYTDIVEKIIQLGEPLLASARYFLVHGDCHLGNTLWQGESCFFLDFDDLCLAPAVQDVWMIVRGRDEMAIKDRETLLEAYEQFQDFDPTELRLIELLRALRIIHYSSWIADRWDDPSFPRAFPDFGNTKYWQEETSELYQCWESLAHPQ
jgi:Ser/Thr protein kinase RdoA (MazF antagonist)